MIKLEVEEYCQECPAFEAVTKHPTVFYADSNIRDCTTVVECEHRKKCKGIERYLRRKVQENGEG